MTSKDEVLAAIRREAAVNNGVPLSQVKFEQVTGIRPHQWKGRYWARWNDALAEAGFEGRTWGPKVLTDEQVITELATLVRLFGHFPTQPEIGVHKRSTPDAMHPSVFRERVGTVEQQRAEVYDFAVSHDGWDDVADIVRPLLTSRATPRPTTSPRTVVGSVYLLKSGNHYKIGRSNSVGRRAYEIGLQLPERLELLHQIDTDDPEGIEAYWHRRFASRRANGEWFDLTNEDVSVFRRRTYM